MQPQINPVSFISAQEKFITFLRSQKRSSATTIAYGGDLEQLRKHLDSHRITQVTTVQTDHLQTYVNELSTQNYTPKSVSRKINSLKTFFKFLETQKIVNQNPAMPLCHPRYTSNPPRILTPTEYRNLREACRLDIRISAIVELLLQTGMRISELANIRLEDVKKTEIYIRSIENNPDRTLPLPKSTVSAIQNYLSLRQPVTDNHLFVTKTGRPLLVRNIRTAIDRYFTKAGVKDAKVNDLRHTYIAHQLAHGVTSEVVNKLVGHRRLSSTQKYLDYVKITAVTTSPKSVEL